MSDRNDRSGRLKERFESDDDEQDKPTQNDTEAKTSKTEQTDMMSNQGQTEQTAVKDRKSVLMYLPEEIHTELDIRFDELNAQHKREHGEPLEKNRDYYPAVIKAALEDKDLQDVLDGKDDKE